jgi:hypothetical protein
MLAGLDKAAMALALAKYAGDLDSERRLIAHVRVWAAEVAVREAWKIIKGRPCLSNMAALAVFDVVRPNRCERCKGAGVVAHHVCGRCGGLGYGRLSGRDIAEAIGVDHCNYIRTWRTRYESAFRYVQGLDSEVFAVLHTADSGHEMMAV